MTFPSPRLSVIIPAHQHNGMTEHCVSSVLESIGNRRDVEIIVVDDASPAPIVLTAETDPRVTVVRAERNLRFSGACNLGARKAAGAFLCFLNNDTSVSGDWANAMVECAEANHDVAVVGARLIYRDGTIQHAGVTFGMKDGFPRHIYRGFPASHPAVSRNRELQAVTGACMLVRSNAFNRVGGFDETFINGFEDIDLCLRLGELGLRTWYCGVTVITHAESVSRRGTGPTPDPSYSQNAQTFRKRWDSRIRRDELVLYIEDGLISVDSSDTYPVHFSFAPELAIVNSDAVSAGIADLLDIRSRQVFDLEKEVGYLTCRLLDYGIEP